MVPQGKYINDPEVLKEAARAAGVADGERVVEDESIAADQVRAGAPHMPVIACTRQSPSQAHLEDHQVTPRAMLQTSVLFQGVCSAGGRGAIILGL